MGILTIGVPLGKAQKRTYVTPAPGAALRLPRVVDATCRRQTQNTVPLRTIFSVDLNKVNKSDRLHVNINRRTDVTFHDYYLAPNFVWERGIVLLV